VAASRFEPATFRTEDTEHYRSATTSLSSKDRYGKVITRLFQRKTRRNVDSVEARRP